MSFRFILEPYKGRSTSFNCPHCHKREYTRYIDTKTGNHIPYHFGRCNRLNNCSYHKNPFTEGYAKEIWKMENGKSWNTIPEKQLIYQPPKPDFKRVFIPENIFKQSLNHYDKNNFVQFLIRQFGKDKAMNLCKQFYIGTSSHWNAPSTVFWLIDEFNRIVSGEVILYENNGKTKKIIREDGSKKRYNSWVHYALKMKLQREGKKTPSWLKEYSKSENPKRPCLFGLPQLKMQPKNKPIAIVESAKTAIVLSAYFPKYIWLAVGGLSLLKKNRLEVLAGRNITLFPDKGAFEKWKKKIETLSQFAKFTISDLLEKKNAAAGTDLADYLAKNFKTQEANFIKEETKNMDSLLKDDIDNGTAYHLPDEW